MGKFDGILLGSDLDGTLLRKDKTISEENRKAIEYFKSEGGIFTFFTGRMPVGAKPVLDQITPNGYVGCANGAGIFDAATGEIIWSMTLDDRIKEILEFVDENFPEAGFEVTTDQIYFGKNSPETEKHRIAELLPLLPCDYRNFEKPIIKILFGVREERMDALFECIKSHPCHTLFDYIKSDKEFFEALPKGASKGALLRKIAELHSIDMRNTIVAGDNDNDVSMLEAAGIGVAVSNASPNAKKAANYHTVSNEEHAIAQIIKDLESGTLLANSRAI